MVIRGLVATVGCLLVYVSCTYELLDCTDNAIDVEEEARGLLSCGEYYLTHPIRWEFRDC